MTKIISNIIFKSRLTKTGQVIASLRSPPTGRQAIQYYKQNSGSLRGLVMTDRKWFFRDGIIHLVYMAPMTESSKRRMVDEIIGWYGASAIVLAYIFVSFHVFSADSMMYQLLNFTGAMGIVYISFKKNAYQPGVLNIIWAIVALIALIRIFLF